MSIRFRLTAYYSGLVTLTFVLLGLATWWITRGQLYALTDRDLVYRCQAVAEEVEMGPQGPHLPEEHTAYEGPHDGYLVSDAAGRPVVQRGLSSEAFAPALTGQARLGVAGNWRWAVQPVQIEGQLVARVLVAHQPQELVEALQRLGGVMEMLVPGLVLCAGAGGWLLAGRALAPVERLAQGARAITEESLSSRLPVTRDELGPLALAFNHLLERLEGSFARQRQLTADASHELRTPLAVIRAITSQKLMRTRPVEEYVDALQRIEETSRDMGKLLESLLFLARSDAHQLGLERQRLDLRPLLEEVIARLGEAQLSCPPQAWVEGDPTRLSQLFFNLLDNAQRHSRGRVEVIVEGTRVQVRDDGPGIAPEHLPHLLERFYRVDPARSQGGVGLGLAICDSIVRAHGGSMQVESQPGRGTTVTVWLRSDQPTLPEELRGPAGLEGLTVDDQGGSG